MAYDASDSLQAVSAGIGGIAAFGTAWEQASALRAQGSFQTTMAGINAQFAAIQAKQVIDQGNVEANRIRQKGESVVSSQRASAAAQGIAVNDAQGSIAEKTNNTELMEADDIATAKSNAWMTSWGIKTQSTLNMDQAQFNRSGEEFAADQTLLTGGLKMLDSAAKIGGIYAKGSTAKTTTTPSSSYPSGLSPGQLFDRSIYGDPNPPQSNSTNFQTGAWWQKPSKDDF